MNNTIASYHYRGRHGDGRLEDGTMSADSPHTVADHLYARGIIPIEIVRIRERAVLDLWFAQGVHVGSQELALFCRQLYTMLQAGVPIHVALREISTTMHHKGLAQRLKNIIEMIENGARLSDSLSKHPTVFSPLFVNIVRAGESTGKLDDIFLNLSEHLEKEHLLREKLTSALRYPLILITMAITAIIIITIFVVPVFAGMIESAGGEMPLPTRILMAISYFFQNHLLMTGVITGSLFGLYRFHRSTVAGRLFWDGLLLKIPGFGVLAQMGFLGRFARSFALVSDAGIPVMQGLSLAAGTVENSYVRSKINQLGERVSEGESFIQSAKKVGIFTPMMLQMLQVGEETGELDELLGHVADHYERELNHALKNINALIEPLMLILIGGLVLVLGLGVFLPYLETLKSALL